MALRPKDVGKFKLMRGTVGDYNFAVWDFVGNCKGEKCELFKICDYAKDRDIRDRESGGREDRERNLKCGIEAFYIRQVFFPFGEIVQKLRDPFLMQWIGLHIIPLYHHLVKMKKLERSLVHVAETDDKGFTRIHPVYREIRSVIKAIRAEWRNSGLLQIVRDEGYLGRLPSPLEEDEPLDGDPNYHKSLYDDGDNEFEGEGELPEPVEEENDDSDSDE